MRKYLVAVIFIITIANSLCILFYLNRSKTVGYVDVLRTIDSYKLKVDMEKKSESKLGGIKTYMDSLKMQYKIIDKKNQANEQQVKRIESDLLQVNKVYQEVYSKENQAINDAVWKRINDEVQRFGKDKNIDLLVGANGMGTVLYGNSKIDFTDQFIAYLNKNYEAN